MPYSSTVSRWIPLLLLPALLFGCTSYETHPETWASPGEAWQVVRAALIRSDLDLLYRSLSPRFREERGIRSIAGPAKEMHKVARCAALFVMATSVLITVDRPDRE